MISSCCRHTLMASSLLSIQVVGLQGQYQECLTLFRQSQEELALYRRHAIIPSHISGFRTPEEGEPRWSPATTRHQMSVGAELEAALRSERPLSTASVESGDDIGLSRLDLRSSPEDSPVNSPQLRRAAQRRNFLSDSSHSSSPHKPSAVSSPPRPGTFSPTLQSGAFSPPLHSGAFSPPQSTSSTNEVRHAMETVRMISSPKVGGRETPTGSRRSSLSLSRQNSSTSGGLNDLLSKRADQAQVVRQAYTVPQKPHKVRIVKPMEGSLTLLKWKLLAMEQQSGAQALQEALKMPGVYVKKDAEEGVKTTRSKEDVHASENTRAAEAQQAEDQSHETSSSPDLTRTPSPEPTSVSPIAPASPSPKTTPQGGSIMSSLLSSQRIVTRGSRLGGLPFGLGASPGLASLSGSVRKNRGGSLNDVDGNR